MKDAQQPLDYDGNASGRGNVAWESALADTMLVMVAALICVTAVCPFMRRAEILCYGFLPRYDPVVVILIGWVSVSAVLLGVSFALKTSVHDTSLHSR